MDVQLLYDVAVKMKMREIRMFLTWAKLDKNTGVYKALFGLQASEQTNTNYSAIQSVSLSAPTCDVTIETLL